MSAAYWFTTDCENGASEVLWEDGERVCRRTRRAGPDGVRQNVTLAPLALGELAQLVRDSLQIDHERVRPLIERLHEKTQGNPFFAIQFLTELADESLPVFNLRE